MKYRAKERLELVHGELCGPITPATPSGKRYFLLLIDDLTRYVWLALIVMKDEAATAIIRLQAGAESESSCKLHMLIAEASSRTVPSRHTARSLEWSIT